MSQARYDCLAPFVTVYSGRGGLNMEYAPPALIAALTGEEVPTADSVDDDGKASGPRNGTFHIYSSASGGGTTVAAIEAVVRISRASKSPFTIVDWRERGLARAAAGRIPAARRRSGMNVNVQRSLQPLRIRYADPLLGRLRSFWRWWSGELIELLPENLQKAIAQRQQKLYVEVDNDKLLLSLGNHAAQREVLRLAPDAANAEDEDIPREVQQTILLLPDDKILAKRISLPAAAEENLREVLGFEMDLHTPFEASEVYFDFTVVGRDRRRRLVTGHEDRRRHLPAPRQQQPAAREPAAAGSAPHETC
jgi:hypothetical protein